MIKYVKNTCRIYFLVTFNARVSLVFSGGGPELLEKLEKLISVKKLGFWSTCWGSLRGQNFSGSSRVYRATTQKEKNWHPKMKVDTQFLWFWFWICVYIWSYLSLAQCMIEYLESANQIRELVIFPHRQTTVRSATSHLANMSVWRGTSLFTLMRNRKSGHSATFQPIRLIT